MVREVFFWGGWGGGLGEENGKGIGYIPRRRMVFLTAESPFFFFFFSIVVLSVMVFERARFTTPMLGPWPAPPTTTTPSS